jgi:polyisoprenoid-binding protein YceI
MYVHTFVLPNKLKATNMKKTTIFIASMLLGVMAFAQAAPERNKPTKETAQVTKWTTDAAHTSVKFAVTHLTVSEVEGRFNKFNGTVESTTPDFNNAQINFTVDIASISTDNDMRDKHLKSDDFFNAEKYPQMAFKSTSFKKVNNTTYALEGNLTIRDVTKKVKFAVAYGGTVTDPYGSTKAGFKATGSISRKEFGLKWNALTEMGGAVVGDKVSMVLSLELAKQK